MTADFLPLCDRHPLRWCEKQLVTVAFTVSVPRCLLAEETWGTKLLQTGNQGSGSVRSSVGGSMRGSMRWPAVNMIWETYISLTAYSGDSSDVVGGTNEQRSYFVVICHAFEEEKLLGQKPPIAIHSHSRVSIRRLRLIQISCLGPLFLPSSSWGRL